MAYVRAVVMTVREMFEIFAARLRLEKARRDHEDSRSF
jgi:hypothetical protein